MFFALTLVKRIFQSGPCCATEPFMWGCKTKSQMEFAFHLTLYLTHSTFIMLQLQLFFTALRLQLHVLMSKCFVFNCSIAGLVFHLCEEKHTSITETGLQFSQLENTWIKEGVGTWWTAHHSQGLRNGCVMCCLLCTTKIPRQSRFNNSTVHTEGRVQGR